MTTSEKADYNRRYYQRNKQYWKDYYKTAQENEARMNGMAESATQPQPDTMASPQPATPLTNVPEK